MTDDEPPQPQHLPQRVIVAAYVLAALCLLVPLAVVGAVFAGVVLVRRGRAVDGIAVIALGVLGAVLGVAMLR